MEFEKLADKIVMKTKYDDIIKNIVISAAMQKESVVRQSIKELLKEVLLEIEREKDNE